MHIILVVSRLRQEDRKFVAYLSYSVRPLNKLQKVQRYSL